MRGLVAAGTVLLLGLACAADEAGMESPAAEEVEVAATPWFTEVAAESGLQFEHRSGASGEFYYPELMQGGGALVDLDNDSLLDIYLVQSGPLPHEDAARPGNALYMNRGPTVDGDLRFEDVSAASRADDRGYGSGVAAGDVDGDGWTDLYVTNLGANVLLRNTGPDAQGTPLFEDITDRAGVEDNGYSTSAAFLDYDIDGDLDLYVVNYIAWEPRLERPCLGYNGQRGYCSPLEYERPQADTLYRNDGLRADGTVHFTDVSDAAGMRHLQATGLGVVAADFDGNGTTDIYVANDQMANHLWLNSGAESTLR